MQKFYRQADETEEFDLTLVYEILRLRDYECRDRSRYFGRLTCFAIADVMQYIHRSYKKAFLHVDEVPLSGYFVQRSVRDVLNGTPDPYLELLFSGKDAMTRSLLDGPIISKGR